MLLLFLISQTVESAEKDKLKVRINQPVKKCWQRQKAFEDTGNSSLCRDFEKVLNTTCESPEKLQCNWTLPPGEKKFKKLEWKAINPRERWNLIKDMVISGWNDEYRAGQWERLEPQYKQALEEGLLKLKETQVDIDHDGKKDQVVVLQKGQCGKSGSQRIFGVIDQNTGNLNNEYREIVLGLGGCGGDIITYDNYAFMFGWEYGWNLVMVWRGFDTLTGKGSLNVCQFKYTKGDVK